MELLTRRIHIFLFALYGAILIGFSQFLFVADSEFWPWNVGYNFPDFFTKPWMWDRIAFYGLFGLVTNLSDNVWQTLHYSRAVSALWCCGLIVVTSLLVLHFTGKRYLALLAAMMVMANTAFVSQGYRLRSDTLAMFLILLGLLLTLRGLARYGIPLCLLSLVVTPKAILFLPPLFVWLLWGQKKWRWWILGGLAVVGLGWVLTDALPRHLEYWQHATKYYFKSGWSGGNRYFLTEQWKGNWWFWILSAVLLVVQRKQKILIAAYLYYLLVMLLYPESFHFFLAALVPVFVIFFCLFAQDFLNQKILTRRIFIGAMFVMSLAVPAWWYRHSTKYPTMVDQIRFFAKIDKYMEDHSFETIFDGVGAFPHRMRPQMYVGPGETGGVLELKLLAANADLPDLLVGGWRFVHLGKEFSEYLDRYFVEVMPDLYMKAFFQFDRACRPYLRRLTLRRMMSHHRYIMENAKVNVKTVKVVISEDDFRWSFAEVPTQRVMPFLEAAPPTPLENCHWYKVAPIVEIPDLGPFNLSQLYWIDK